MHRDPEQATAHPRHQPPTEPAVEAHGRVVTTNTTAATFYRQAQQAADSPQASAALRLAITADPAFSLALADLDAITATPPSRTSGRRRNWERHHIEIVRAAAAGNLSRATDLLREHHASLGCDPLARASSLTSNNGWDARILTTSPAELSIATQPG